MDQLHPISIAARNGNINEVRRLLNNRTVNTRTPIAQETPLMLAIAHNRRNIVSHILNRYPNAIRARNLFNHTPLMYSVLHNRPELTRLLLNRGANKNARNEDNLTAMHLAAAGGRHRILRFLIENGATITPEIMAIARNNATRNFIRGVQAEREWGVKSLSRIRAAEGNHTVLLPPNLIKHIMNRK